MNQPNPETPGLELPPPVAEPAPGGPNPGETAPATPERTAGAETAPTTGQRAAPSMIPLPTPPPMPAAGQPVAVSPTTPTAALTDEDDGDLIEKEWVNKAKQIVERTRNDPHKQSEELTVFKAGYMKKHYDKTIKVNK